MCDPASFHSNDATRDLIENLGERKSFDLKPEDTFACSVKADEVESVFANVYADHREICKLCNSILGHSRFS